MPTHDAVDLRLLEVDLRHDESTVLRVYDDANGHPIVPGSHVIGHPTIGIGRALDVNGISDDEATDMLWADMARYAEELMPLPWFAGLDRGRRRAVMNMRHQMGLNGLLGFRKMIAAIGVGNYVAAAAAGLDSQWARTQSPARAVRVMALLEHGDPQGVST
jgi:lysozyme